MPLKKPIIAAVLGLVLSLSAFAHTQLSSSVPADEAQLDAAPKELKLTFSEAVRLTAVSIDHASEKRPIELEAEAAAKEFTVALPALEPGDYVVEWRALSEDTHVVSGEIRFTITA